MLIEIQWMENDITIWLISSPNVTASEHTAINFCGI